MRPLHSWLLLALTCVAPLNAQVLTNASAPDPLEGAWIRVEEIRQVVGPAPADPGARVILRRGDRDGWYAFPAAPGVRLFVQGHYSAVADPGASSSGRYESDWAPGDVMSAGILVQHPIGEQIPAGADQSEVYGYQIRADSLFITRLIDRATGPAPGTSTIHFVRAR
jgi:hypothetical protein